MNRTPEDRLTELETQLAYTQRINEQLNEMVTRLTLDARRRDVKIDRLVEEMKSLKVKADSSGGRSPGIPSDDAQYEDNRPPHY